MIENHSCLTTPDQYSNCQLPLPSPDMLVQSCQSMSTPALMSQNSRKYRTATEICDFKNSYQLMDDDNVKVLSLALKKLNLFDS